MIWFLCSLYSKDIHLLLFSLFRFASSRQSLQCSSSPGLPPSWVLTYSYFLRNFNLTILNIISLYFAISIYQFQMSILVKNIRLFISYFLFFKEILYSSLSMWFYLTNNMNKLILSCGLFQKTFYVTLKKIVHVLLLLN